MAATAAPASTANPSPSPNPDEAAPGPPSTPSRPQRSASALAPSAAAAERPLLLPPAASRLLAPPCWGHEETLALIDAYREKWYELRRGNLRASHWQEVADAVRRRCQRLAVASASAKTAVQCRHKVEKLRQRYRAEKQRLALRGSASKPRSSSWVYFPQMDAMELGNASPSLSPSSDSGNEGHSNSGLGGGGGGGGDPKNPHKIQLGFNGVGGGAGLEFRIPKASRTKIIGANSTAAKPKPGNGGFFKGGFSGARRPAAAVGVMEEGAGEVKGRGLVWEMVEAVKTLGDEFTRVEEMKMEMVRDVEKLRREMELKRTEMIVHSQRQIVDYIRGLHHKKKRAKVAPELVLE